MGQEIERKFLVNEIPADFCKSKHFDISQGYLVVEKEYEIRLRKKGNSYFQSVKLGHGLQREEVEIKMSAEQFNVLWPLTQKKRLEKIRYEMNIDGYCIELDVYKNNLTNLITAEVEFKTIEDSRFFSPPNWFGPEVTGISEYSNKYLAIHGLPQNQMAK
jgi:adenylate cyclase